MLFVELLKTAWQSLRTNPRRSLLTIFGIVIGIAAVITIISLGNGVKAKLLNELEATSTGKQTTKINYYSSNGSDKMGFVQNDVEQIKGNFSSLAQVKVLNPTSHITTNAQIGSQLKNVSVTLLQKPITGLRLIAGSQFTHYDLAVASPVALINQKMAKKQYHDPANAIGTSVEIKHVYYRVIGVFTSSISRYQTNFLLPKQVFYQNLSSNSGNTLKLTFNQGVNVSKETKRIVKFLKKNGTQHKNGHYEYFDLGKLLKSISKVIDELTIFISAIAGISLFIAGIGVMNMMYTSVSERTQEIGIRLAVGAQPNSILLQFLLEAVMLTVSGGLLGFALGGLIAKLISLALPFKAVLTLNSFLLAFGVSAFVGIVFGILPAKQAANKNLIDILR
ncbi:ABC transporter permease [Liquorilactobacillus sicerae]|uniref:ABC transporter permease n=1 Tax=Liquorilactobacillus sicerae TaxID=1416943 RepID=UPI0024817AA9|nr:ABC transporter permease [Liquorilactobacillus sicerae]